MPKEINYRVSSATAGADAPVEVITVDTQVTDGVTGQNETTYMNSNWSKYFGYYRLIPECKTAVDVLSRWVIGDGYIVDDSRTEVILDSIKGWGTDTFDDILENMERCAIINGDSFCEQIRDEDGELINLKPLDPGSMRIVVDKQGMLKRYEQVSKTKEGEGVIKFDPAEIFHLSNNRIADEIHGISIFESLTGIIDASNESFKIQTEITRNFSKPKLMVALDTEDQAKIDAFITKFDAATNKGTNLFFPKGTVEPTVLAVPPNGTLNVLSWRDHLKNYFYQVVGIPQILQGGAAEFSESSAKISYLSFEQTVKQRQRYIITQVWNQLYLKIDLDVPASLQNELLSDESKDKNQGMEFQPGDTTAGVAE